MIIKNEDILEQFRSSNPKLIKLNPVIEISEIRIRLDSRTNKIIEYNPPILQIAVKHPFIFDMRLMPKVFEGIQIRAVCIEEFPPELYHPDQDKEGEFIRLEEYYAIEKYQLFVKNNINLIRERLSAPDMSEVEALDAITGGADKHIEWINELKSKRSDEKKSECQ